MLSYIAIFAFITGIVAAINFGAAKGLACGISGIIVGFVAWNVARGILIVVPSFANTTTNDIIGLISLSLCFSGIVSVTGNLDVTFRAALASSAVLSVMLTINSPIKGLVWGSFILAVILHVAKYFFIFVAFCLGLFFTRIVIWPFEVVDGFIALQRAKKHPQKSAQLLQHSLAYSGFRSNKNRKAQKAYGYWAKI